jgi:hypothetical protein
VIESFKIFEMSRPKKYNIDESYFDEIDTDEKAYVLGFLYADSHIDRGFDIAISNKDIEILNFIKKEIKSNHPISIGPKYSRLSIHNLKISKDLFNLGIVKNKNNSLNLPTLKNELMPSFLLGLIDGDGHINKEESYFELSGGETLLLQIKEYLKKELNLNLSLRYRYSKENKNSCGLFIKGSLNVGKLGEYLYRDKDIGLKRKKDKFMGVIEKESQQEKM